MPTATETADLKIAITDALLEFVERTDHEMATLDSNTNLIRGLGMTSDQGVEFALDLSDALGFELPANFNPFVHESGMRGRRFGELVTAVQGFAAEQEKK